MKINDELPAVDLIHTDQSLLNSGANVTIEDSQSESTSNPACSKELSLSVYDCDMEIEDTSELSVNHTLRQNVDISLDQTDLSAQVVDMQISSASDVDESTKTSFTDKMEIVSDVTLVPEEELALERPKDEYFQNHSLIELARFSWESNADKQMYTRGCLWSPDGTCILTAVNMDGMHVMELPKDLYDNVSVPSGRTVNKLQTAVHVPEGGTVYDYSWYPFMNSSAPETCCWLASRQHEPIHMWDAFTGERRCTYRSYDAVDEVQSAISVTFSPDGQSVIGGYKTVINIFDTNRPGRDCHAIKTKQASSCFAISESSPDVIITGTWKGTINMYDSRMPHLGSLFTLYGHASGVTYLKHASDPNVLFSGARMENKLFEWDLRNFEKPVRILKRKVDTNQRIYFDISPCENWLASGDTDGTIHVWDSQSSYERQLVFPLHEDCCNGISFHPSRPILSTSSGQYHFLKNDMESSENSTKKMYENSLILWWCGSVQENEK